MESIPDSTSPSLPIAAAARFRNLGVGCESLWSFSSRITIGAMTSTTAGKHLPRRVKLKSFGGLPVHGCARLRLAICQAGLPLRYRSRKRLLPPAPLSSGVPGPIAGI